jgi:hypothetical protein
MATFPIDTDDNGTPRAALAIAADAVRAFNHRTGTQFDPDSESWWYAGDAYDALGELGAIADRLAQSIQHVSGSVAQQMRAGEIGADHGGNYPDAAAAAEAVSVALEHARQAAHRLSAAISEAHSATAVMHYTGPER